MELEDKVKKAFAAAILRSEDPMAPVKLQEAHHWVTQLGSLTAGMCTKETADAFTERLIKDFSEQELEKIGGDPALICALCSILLVVTERYIRNLAK